MFFQRITRIRYVGNETGVCRKDRLDGIAPCPRLGIAASSRQDKATYFRVRVNITSE
ncbi:hypothetical protein [Spirosoma sp. KNUC1025]|uniref:hypothetical protein n=1 Tax=Spirosoma sp. KNUC1025 TaxID=2894082 RepID=UPI0038693C16|nr:hypothetical protein LN737_19765 [Spirosoma sp. KNUC1025]